MKRSLSLIKKGKKSIDQYSLECEIWKMQEFAFVVFGGSSY